MNLFVQIQTCQTGGQPYSDTSLFRQVSSECRSRFSIFNRRMSISKIGHRCIVQAQTVPDLEPQILRLLSLQSQFTAAPIVWNRACPFRQLAITLHLDKWTLVDPHLFGQQQQQQQQHVNNNNNNNIRAKQKQNMLRLRVVLFRLFAHFRPLRC